MTLAIENITIREAYFTLNIDYPHPQSATLDLVDKAYAAQLQNICSNRRLRSATANKQAEKLQELDAAYSKVKQYVQQNHNDKGNLSSISSISTPNTRSSTRRLNSKSTSVNYSPSSLGNKNNKTTRKTFTICEKLKRSHTTTGVISNSNQYEENDENLLLLNDDSDTFDLLSSSSTSSSSKKLKRSKTFDNNNGKQQQDEKEEQDTKLNIKSEIRNKLFELARSGHTIEFINEYTKRQTEYSGIGLKSSEKSRTDSENNPTELTGLQNQVSVLPCPDRGSKKYDEALIHIAVKTHNIDLFKFLVESNIAVLDDIDTDGCNFLHHCAKLNSESIIEYVVKKFKGCCEKKGSIIFQKSQQKDHQNFTPLALAALYGQLEALVKFIDMGQSVDIRVSKTDSHIAELVYRNFKRVHYYSKLGQAYAFVIWYIVKSSSEDHSKFDYYDLYLGFC